VQDMRGADRRVAGWVLELHYQGLHLALDGGL